MAMWRSPGGGGHRRTADDGQAPSTDSREMDVSRHSTEDVLESSPFDDDLADVLAARPGGAGASKLTLTLAGAVLLVAGLLLGIQAHKAFGGTGSASAFPGRAGGGAAGAGTGARAGGGGFGGFGNGGGFGAGGGSGGGFGGGGVTFGTVKLVDGGKVYVQTAGGGVVTVTTGKDTKIQVSKAGKVSDLKPGNVVVVNGTKDAQGNVTATTVTESSQLAGRRAGS
ncbi:hypothetical protein [Microbispora corallina]|uniref:hypothetical protein n=1 Tax=Microbispora corallina TaxID=83302 RepID=UPI0019510D3A|nr:hypothetical protein [Microbispora corallina]